MQQAQRLTLPAVIALATLFALILVYTILRRAETAYYYPSYSSLNNSELGTKAYFEVLARLGFAPVRNYKQLQKLEGIGGAIFYAGPEMPLFRFSNEKELREFEQLAKGGARVVIALDPEAVIELHSDTAKKQQTTEDTLKKRWGIELASVDRHVSYDDRLMLRELNMKPVNWQFSSWPAAWTPSHVRNGTPLFLERVFGKGSIVLIGDSKLFTNRELLVHPQNDVLTGVPGGHYRIIFDETHLGLENTGTVVGLARNHGLTWILLGFAMLAILYIWRSAFSFIPRFRRSFENPEIGHDAHVALSNLLRQSVPPKWVVRVAAEEWNRSAKLLGREEGRVLDRATLAGLESIAPGAAAAAYRNVSAHLNTKMKMPGSARAL